MSEAISYDYIIIGAGASGCVIANRLSADPKNKVLVLEAGGVDTNPDIADVGGFVRLWGGEEDWKLHTTNQDGFGGREIVINQGKVLGGSTALNAMMYVRGNKKNFDRWSELGAEGWSYNDVLPYFKKLENYADNNSEYHHVGGPLTIRDCPDDVMRSEPFLVGATEAGYDGPRWDYNGGRQEDGAGFLQFHIDNAGKRESSATVFLHPVMDRENLTVVTAAFVTKIVIENGQAVAVEYTKDGQPIKAQASKEIIVSAGALASPKILLLSGIGPASELQQVGVEVVADLPGVGKNLQDHIQLPVLFRSTLDLPMTTLLTGNVLFVNTKGDGKAPDLQINFTPSMPAPLSPILPDFGGPVCIFLAILVQPESKGEVKLTSSDPKEQQIVNPAYLKEKADLEVFYKALEIIRKIAATPTFSATHAGEIAPGPGDPEGFIRSQGSTLWHPAGTCKMGSDAMSVVDPQLKVRGIKKLRVADASVMPEVVSGNTVASCFMIGERAAEMILSDN